MPNYRLVVILGAATLAVAGCADGGSPPVDSAPIAVATETPAASPEAPSPQPPVASPTQPSPAWTGARDPLAEVEIDDQSGDGTSVTVDSIELARDAAMLVIRDRAGNVHAATRVTPHTTPVRVPLKQPVRTSQELVAELYLDNGNGRFDPRTDQPIVDDDGDLVREEFHFLVTR